MESQFFAGLTIVIDRPTDHATRSVTIGRIYIRSTAMRPKISTKRLKATVTKALVPRTIKYVFRISGKRCQRRNQAGGHVCRGLFQRRGPAVSSQLLCRRCTKKFLRVISYLHDNIGYYTVLFWNQTGAGMSYRRVYCHKSTVTIHLRSRL